jgi:hypothetical protein
MLEIFPDESLHGYILRIIISQGLRYSQDDIDGIIGRLSLINGKLNIAPSISFNFELALTKEQRDIFKHFPVSALIKLLKEHMPIRGYPRYANPKSLVSKCGRIFFNINSDVIEDFMSCAPDYLWGRYPVRYCPKCIKEQIQECGAGWFKLNWLFEDVCYLHRLKLVEVSQLVCSCRISIFNRIQFALSGVCPCCREVGWPDQKKTSELIYAEELDSLPKPESDAEWFYYPSLTKEEYIGIPVSDCFNRIFEEWLKWLYLNLFSRGELDKSSRSIVVEELSKYKYVLDGSINPLTYLFHMLSVFEMYENSTFFEFINEYAEIIEIDCSDVVLGQVVVSYQVAKDRNCAACRVVQGQCPLKV